MIDRARTMKRGTAGRDVGKTQSVYLGLRGAGCRPPKLAT